MAVIVTSGPEGTKVSITSRGGEKGDETSPKIPWESMDQIQPKDLPDHHVPEHPDPWDTWSRGNGHVDVFDANKVQFAHVYVWDTAEAETFNARIKASRFRALRTLEQMSHADQLIEARDNTKRFVGLVEALMVEYQETRTQLVAAKGLTYHKWVPMIENVGLLDSLACSVCGEKWARYSHPLEDGGCLGPEIDEEEARVKIVQEATEGFLARKPTTKYPILDALIDAVVMDLGELLEAGDRVQRAVSAVEKVLDVRGCHD